MEKVVDFILLCSKNTVDGNCSHEIKIYLLLGRKTMKNLDSILKSRGITMMTKACIVKAVLFFFLSVVICECEIWTIKKAEHQRTNAFDLWSWRTLRVPLTAQRSNQSILKKINLIIH